MTDIEIEQRVHKYCEIVKSNHRKLNTPATVSPYKMSELIGVSVNVIVGILDKFEEKYKKRLSVHHFENYEVL